MQELVFGEEQHTNLILFQTAAPVLGLGEGADQFDRRGVNYPLINGQRYRLAELGTRIFSPFLIGTEGWAMFVNAPPGGVDLRGERGAGDTRARIGPARRPGRPGKRPGTAPRTLWNW